MNLPLKLGRPLPLLATAFCLLIAAWPSAGHAQQYPPQTQKPRVGTRIINFVKDLMYGEQPQSRYRGYAPPPAPTQSHSYGARGSGGGGQRYNLDRPPAAAEYHQDTPPAPQQNDRPEPPSRYMPPHDMPYAAPKQDVPSQSQNDGAIGDAPPSKVKPRTQSKPPTEPARTVQTKKTEPKHEVQDSPPSTKEETPSPAPTERRTEPSPQITSTTTSTVKESPPSTPKESPSSAPASNGSALTGTKTSKSGLVKSPYAPYNELDVTGLPSGSLAMDPTTGKVFRVP